MTFNPANAPTLPLGAALDKARANWGWYVALGVLAVITGFLALVFVVAGTLTTVLMIGIAMAVCGGVEIYLGFHAKSWGWVAVWILTGFLLIVAGALAIAQPLFAAEVFTMMLGVALIFVGVARTISGFELHGSIRGIMIFDGIVSLFLGILILARWPTSSVYVLGIFLGVDLLFYGIAWIMLGMRLKNA